MADLTQFEIGSAQRIARVVRQVEQEPRRARPLTFGALTFDAVQGGQQKVFRVGTFTGAWSKNALKTVSLANAATTLPAVNLFAAIGSSTAARNCAIAKDGTAWYLIAAEC